MGTHGQSSAISRREFIEKTTLVGATLAVSHLALGSAEAEGPAKTLDAEPYGAYRTIDKKTWDQILKETFPWQPPFTVHLPIQPVHSPDFVHVDCALNACRRRVFPKPIDPKEEETLLVQFAFDEPPLVPDFRLSRMALAKSKYPVPVAEYSADGFDYRLEYCCSAVEENQSLLWIRVAVTNKQDAPRTAHVRVKVNFQRECDVFPYHYESYFWDNRKWKPCDKVKLRGDAIQRDSASIGKIVAGDFSYRWEPAASFTDEQFTKKYGDGAPQSVPPNLRLKNVQDVIHFTADLRPNEQRTFTIALLTNYEKVTPAEREALTKAEFEPSRRNALKDFQSQLRDACTQLVCPQDGWDRISTALQLSTLQLLVRFPGETKLTPTQGGSSERCHVWVWEAAFMLLPMLRLGHFQAVRRSLEYIFSLQDAGYAPEGKLTSTSGAVGTTGPKWLNTTGTALALAVEYDRYAHDTTFVPEYLPKILKAMQWIVGEIRATRKLNADGSRPAYYGLMPFGCATDSDIGYIVAFTDAYTFWGLEKAVLLLERLKHARAAEFRSELEAYRADLGRAIETMTRADGFIDRKILTGKERHIYGGFENICCAAHLAFTGVLSPESDRFRRFLGYFEEHRMDGYFTGNLGPDRKDMANRNTVYIGFGEYIWQDAYLRLGQWKKAFAATRMNLRYGMTQDALQVQERFCKRDPAFTPWQPNGSGNGRMLDMMLNSIYFERAGVATLLGAIPFAWLAHNRTTALKGLYTPRGKLTIEARMTDQKNCRLTLSAIDQGALPQAVRLPDHFWVVATPKQVERQGDGSLRISPDAHELSFVLQQQRDI